MKHLYLILMGVLTLSCSGSNPEPEWFDRAVDVAHRQLLYQVQQSNLVAGDRCFARSMADSSATYVNAYDWTSGFAPGNLWLGYELTGDTLLLGAARDYTDRLEQLQYYTGTHDLGFMIFCSYGQAQRLAPRRGDTTIIINGSRSLISRFDSTICAIRSWDFGEWNYPVIIDNMMNLEMLFWASRVSGDSLFARVATTHANTTLKNHFRDDVTSYHVVSYNDDGSVESQGTNQGYSDSSPWARGQAWGLYGYTTLYRFTGQKKHLDLATAIAKYIMENAPSQSDLIPYWDYQAPLIPNEPRDASAAAITASALLELGGYVDRGDLYFDYAERILRQLSSSDYLAPVGENCGFILQHSVGHRPAGSEVDVPLNYADYYFLEALLRFKALR
ncbi:MAG: glycoside hydrolase family 88 protein [Rikenellaceae bacterium]